MATDFGTTRNPLSGGNSKHTRSDSLHPDLFIEHKHRKANATVKLYDETKKLAAEENKIPVVTLSQHGRGGYLIVVDPQHLEAIMRAYKPSWDATEENG